MTSLYTEKAKMTENLHKKWSQLPSYKLSLETAAHPGIYEVIIHHNDRAFGYLNPSSEANLQQAGGIEKPLRLQIDTAGNLTFLDNNRADNPPENRADNLELLTAVQGVFLRVANEKDHQPTFCFTGVAKNLCIWAAQVA